LKEGGARSTPARPRHREQAIVGLPELLCLFALGNASRKLRVHSRFLLAFMADTGVIDAARQEEFVGKVVEQISGTMTTLLGAIGDRLGLFKNLAEQGPATSAELASRTKLNERYLREWLGGMATAGYLNYDGPTRRFSLPAEHASVLAQENGPFFVGGMYQMLPAFTSVFDQVLTAFRNGGGVSQSQYNDMMWDGLERFTSTWFDNLLLQQ
jgi:hypothetical protein